MSLYRDAGIVLRTHKLGEADRIITLLTRERGVVRAAARGIRKTTSRFGARLEPFMHVDLQMGEGKSLDFITQVVTINAFARDLGADYGAYTVGCAMLETAERLVADTAEPSVPQFTLLVGALRALTERREDPGLILDSFQLRSLAIAGYAPSFEACARCGVEGPHTFFQVAAGGILCDRCRSAGATAPSPATVQLLGSLLAGDWPTARSSDDRARREASGIVAAYLSWHLERGLRSLAHVDRYS